MDVELIMLGGAEEIGANSCYLNIGGHGIIIDAGLHPRRRDRFALPQLEFIADKTVHSFVLTHAHTDHVGGLPFIMKQQPHARMIATRPTRDLIEIMLRSTIKLLKLDNTDGLPENALEFYDHALLDKFGMAFDAFLYDEAIPLASAVTHNGETLQPAVSMSFHDAGHIIGSAGIKFEAEGKTIFHSGDVQFGRQSLLPGANFPKEHLDCLIIECTNGADENPRSYADEKQRLADFINGITNQNGSVLLPTFALGKTQEVLKVVANLMNSAKIPKMPIYTGGMSKRIAKIYDRYSHVVPRVEPGFSIRDIPQTNVRYEEMMAGKFFTEPSIVVISSGMVNEGSPSYTLAQKWLELPNFGIGIMGYQDPSAPGHALLESQLGEEFTFGSKLVKRLCALERFRFSAHASRETILDYISTVRPKHLFLVHGDAGASESVGAAVKAKFPEMKIYIPTLGKSYKMEL
jgi:cleavage and polyadenylation specificity factor subunit 3